MRPFQDHWHQTDNQTENMIPPQETRCAIISKRREMCVGRGIGFNILILVCIDVQAIRPKVDPLHTQGTELHKNGARGEHILSSQSRDHICAQYQRWQSISAHPYTGIAQIGGTHALRPSNKRMTGAGNRSNNTRQPLSGLKEVRNRVGTNRQSNLIEEGIHNTSRDTGINLLRQTTMNGWLSKLSNNIATPTKDRTHLLHTEFNVLNRRLPEDNIDKGISSQVDKLAQTRRKREERIIEANRNSPPSRFPSQRLGIGAEEIMSFERINVNGLSAHDEFVELSNAMGILENIEAGVYNVVETQWDATCPKFCTYIQETLKHKDIYAKATFSSNMNESFLTLRKSGGTMLGVSGW